MKNKTILFIILACAGLAFVLPKSWVVNTKDAKIKFIAGGPMGTKVNGTFGGLKATINFDPANLQASNIAATVAVSTIETGIGLRNKDLKEKEEWFDVVKYPEIAIRSTKIEKAGDGYKLIGLLTLKGVTRAIEFPFGFTPTGTGGVFKGSFTISREDYKLGGNGGMVGKDITINLEVPVSN